MAHDLCSYLREEIKKYIADRNGSIRWFSLQCDVDYSTVHRIHSGELESLNFKKAKKIIKLTDPKHLVEKLAKFFPDEIEEILAVGEQRAKERMEIANHLMESFELFQTFTLITAIRGDVTRDFIAKKAGEVGLANLDILLDLGALVDEEGRFKDNLEGKIDSSSSVAKQLASFTNALLDLEKPASFIQNFRWGYSKEGVKAGYEAGKAYLARMEEIDQTMRGDIPVVASISFGPISWGDNQVTSHNFETRVNNYKKAYDLDQATAQKVAMVAHDMRGPLGYIQNYMDMRSNLNQSEEQFHLARSAMKRINSMLNSFKDLKSEAVIVRDKGWLYFDECKDLAESYSHQYGKDFEFSGSLEFDADLDAEKVDRALQNLITNAFEAARTAVRVEVFRQDSELIMIVSDDGPGVPDESIPRLFKRGFTEGKDNGTGLGLAFVKHVADGHGGSVEYARSIDDWTQFKITIPHVFFDDMVESQPEARGVPSNHFLEAEESEELALQKPAKKRDDPEKRRRLAEICSQKPIFLVLLDRSHWTHEKYQLLQQLLPDYTVSDDYEDVEKAWFICMDSDDTYYDYIMAQKLNAIWMPGSSNLTSSSLVNMLWGMGENELKKFRTMKQKILAGKAIET